MNSMDCLVIFMLQWQCYLFILGCPGSKVQGVLVQNCRIGGVGVEESEEHFTILHRPLTLAVQATNLAECRLSYQ